MGGGEDETIAEQRVKNRRAGWRSRARRLPPQLLQLVCIRKIAREEKGEKISKMYEKK